MSLGTRTLSRKRRETSDIVAHPVGPVAQGIAIWSLRIVVIILILVSLFSVFGSECVDAMYMLNSGRWMATHHALQVTNIASVVPNMGMVVQNWLLCLAYWHIYELGLSLGVGFLAVRMAHCISMLVLYVAVGLMAQSSSRHPSVPWIAMGVVAMGYSLPAIRIHALALLVMIACMWVANRVLLREIHMAWLLLIPPACMLHANTQSSLAVIDALLVLAMAVSNPAGKVAMRQRIGVIVAGILGIASCVMTPYGLDGMLYARSITGMTEFLKISELSSLLEFSLGLNLYVPCAASCFVVIILSSVAAVHNDRRDLIVPCLLAIASFGAAFITARFLLQATATATFLAIVAMDEVVGDFASGMLEMRMRKTMPWKFGLIIRHPMTAFTILTSVSMVAVMTSALFGMGLSAFLMLGYAKQTQSVTWLPNTLLTPWHVGELMDGEGCNVLCSPNAGSYMEFLGHKVSASSRWEVWREPSEISPDLLRDTIVTLSQKDGEEDVEGLFGGISRIDWDYAVIDPRYDYPFCDWISRQPDWVEVSQERFHDGWSPYVPSQDDEASVQAEGDGATPGNEATINATAQGQDGASADVEDEAKDRRKPDNMQYRIWKHVTDEELQSPIEGTQPAIADVGGDPHTEANGLLVDISEIPYVRH